MKTLLGRFGNNFKQEMNLRTVPRQRTRGSARGGEAEDEQDRKRERERDQRGDGNS